jgi:hypothetical protein
MIIVLEKVLFLLEIFHALFYYEDGLLELVVLLEKGFVLFT